LKVAPSVGCSEVRTGEVVVVAHLEVVARHLRSVVEHGVFWQEILAAQMARGGVVVLRLFLLCHCGVHVGHLLLFVDDIEMGQRLHQANGSLGACLGHVVAEAQLCFDGLDEGVALGRQLKADIVDLHDRFDLGARLVVFFLVWLLCRHVWRLPPAFGVGGFCTTNREQLASFVNLLTIRVTGIAWTMFITNVRFVIDNIDTGKEKIKK